MKFFRDMFTEKDNKTYSLFRVLLALGFLTFLWISAVIVLNKPDVQMMTVFAGGVTTILGAGGWALRQQSSAEAPVSTP